jgi:hypothetical protein
LKDKGRVSFKKFHHINAKKDKILRLARNPAQLKKHVTTRTPRQTVLVKVDSRKRTEISVSEIFIDDVEEFKDVLDLKASKLGVDKESLAATDAQGSHSFGSFTGRPRCDPATDSATGDPLSSSSVFFIHSMKSLGRRFLSSLLSLTGRSHSIRLKTTGQPSCMMLSALRLLREPPRSPH